MRAAIGSEYSIHQKPLLKAMLLLFALYPPVNLNGFQKNKINKALEFDYMAFVIWLLLLIQVSSVLSPWFPSYRPCIRNYHFFFFFQNCQIPLPLFFCTHYVPCLCRPIALSFQPLPTLINSRLMPFAMQSLASVLLLRLPLL